MTDERVEAVLAGRERWTVVLGDCREAMAAMPAGSVDAVVCDPPYGLEFMGKEWDKLDGGADRARRGGFLPGTEEGRGFGGSETPFRGAAFDLSPSSARSIQRWHETWARAALRVLKPGGHLIAMGGTRVWHRLACGIEDAGFEVRDSLLAFTYGSGFPKSYNLDDDTGTALKPAWEPIVAARKPLVGTVAENVRRFGTGALNITATRVGFAGPADESEAKTKNAHERFGSGPMTNRVYGEFKEDRPDYTAPGRWPPNVLLVHLPECRPRGTKVVAVNAHYPEGHLRGYGANLGGETGGQKYEYVAEGPRPQREVVEDWACADGCPVLEMDRQSSSAQPSKGGYVRKHGDEQFFGTMGDGATDPPTGITDEGGASRFFPRFGWDDEERSFIYTPKASRSEREAGLGPELPLREISYMNTAGGNPEKGEPWNPVDERTGVKRERFRATVRNRHPTVKPIALMRWLVRLVTPTAGVVLDPFAGSGTTGCAAVPDGFRFIGIEAEAEYVAIAEARVRYWQGRPESQVPSHPLLTGRPPGQLRLERWAGEPG